MWLISFTLWSVTVGGSATRNVSRSYSPYSGWRRRVYRVSQHADEGTSWFTISSFRGCKDVVITERPSPLIPQVNLSLRTWPFPFPRALFFPWDSGQPCHMTLFREQELVEYCKLKLCWSWFGCLLEMEMLYNSAGAVCPVPQLFSGTRISCKVEPATD